MATSLKLTRNQLAGFLKDPESIKQFEKLFALVDEDLNSGLIDGLNIAVGGSDAKAQQAVDALDRISRALDLLTNAPVIERNNSLQTDYIDFPDFAGGVDSPRRLQWNVDNGTLDIGLYGGSVLQTGQEIMYYAKNTSGATIANGTTIMFTGVVGASGKITIGKAVANGTVSARSMLGVATQDIPNNAFGYVTSFGFVRGFDTSGTPYGEVWADGDGLFFSASTPGGWTKVQPAAPAIATPVAVVINAASGGAGTIHVRMDQSLRLSNIQDASIVTPANGDLLVYNSGTTLWTNTAQSLLSVGTATNLAGGAAGSLPYQTGAGATTFLAPGTANYVLTTNGTTLVWTQNTGTGNAVRAASPTLTGTVTAATITASGLVSSSAGMFVSGNSTPASGQNLELRYSGGGLIIAYDRTAAAYQPMLVQGSTITLSIATTPRLQIDANGNVYAGSGATTMTNTFFYIPAAAGVPTGVPTAITGRVPMYYDTTNNNFYIYNGAWKKVLLT